MIKYVQIKNLGGSIVNRYKSWAELNKQLVGQPFVWIEGNRFAFYGYEERAQAVSS